MTRRHSNQNGCTISPKISSPVVSTQPKYIFSCPRRKRVFIPEISRALWLVKFHICQLIMERDSGILRLMIVCPNAPPLTVEDYRSLPEAGPRYQLIEGDLYMYPAPNRFYQEISRNLQGKLFLYLRESGSRRFLMRHSMFTLTRRMFISRIWS